MKPFGTTVLAVVLPLAALAESSTDRQVKDAFDEARKNDERCIVASQLEATANRPPQERAQPREATRFYDFRHGDCPSEEKRKAEAKPLDR